MLGTGAVVSFAQVEGAAELIPAFIHLPLGLPDLRSSILRTGSRENAAAEVNSSSPTHVAGAEMDIHQEMSDLLTCVWVSRAKMRCDVRRPWGKVPRSFGFSGRRNLSVPWRAGTLIEAVVRTLVAASSRVFSGGMGERVDQMTPEALAADPLVQCLCQQFADLGRPGLRRDVVPVLVVCWVSSRVLGGQIGELGLQEKALIRQSEKLANRLQGIAKERVRPWPAYMGVVGQNRAVFPYRSRLIGV